MPEVERRDVRCRKFPSKDFEIGVFVGTYATQNFGASAVVGVRLGYHLTEDFFVEARLRAEQGQRQDLRRDLARRRPLADTDKKLSYYNVSAGYNVLPGEVFLGSKYAKASSIYLIGGVGSTNFADQRTPDLQRRLRLPRAVQRPLRGAASTCATTSSRSTCSASARARRTSS